MGYDLMDGTWEIYLCNFDTQRRRPIPGDETIYNMLLTQVLGLWWI